MRLVLMLIVGQAVLCIIGTIALFGSFSSSGAFQLRRGQKDEKDSNQNENSEYDDDEVKCDETTIASSGAADNDRSSSPKEDKNTCTIWVAPTSIPNNSGYGVYSTKAFEAGSTVLSADAPSIPIIDPDYSQDEWIPLFKSYFWVRGVADDVSFEARQAPDLGVTLGSLPNHHAYLQNMGIALPKIPYDDSWVNRSVDSGAGAFSYHKGRDFTARRDIAAGEELFLDYGHGEHNMPKWMETVPRYRNFIDGGEIVTHILEEMDTLREKLVGCDGKAARLSLKQKKEAGAILSAVSKIVSVYSETTASMLPKNFPELERIFKYAASSTDPSDLTDGLVEEMMNTRSVDWIVENGLCLDNIIPGRSKLDQAGHGAIAQRLLKKGNIILPVPMLQIMNRDVLAMYRDDKATPSGTQLLMNYCFGHHESSLLICPMTNAILINHCSARNRQCGDAGPNAEYRWATGWDDSKTTEWLKLTLEEISKMPGRGLALEIFATRDINPGEEIFIDYGRKWEEAWDHHVANWKPPSDGSEFGSSTSVKILNDNPGRFVELESGDLRKESSHSKIFSACVYWEDRAYQWESSSNDKKWKKLEDKNILSLYSEDGQDYEIEAEFAFDGSYWPCSIIREDGKDSYIVRIFQSNLHRKTEWKKMGIPRFIRKYPRSSIRYFNRKYESDQHLPGAFRHSIEIRDNLFPPQWKDRKSDPS